MLNLFVTLARSVPWSLRRFQRLWQRPDRPTPAGFSPAGLTPAGVTESAGEQSHPVKARSGALALSRPGHDPSVAL